MEQEDHWVVVGAGLAAVAVVEPLKLEVVVTWIVQQPVLAVLQGLRGLLFGCVCLVQSHMIDAVPWRYYSESWRVERQEI